MVPVDGDGAALVRTSRCAPARLKTAVQESLQNLMAPLGVAALLRLRD
jgi:hypothetical protein